MNAQTSRLTPGSRSLSRVLASGVMLGLTLGLSLPADGAFHLWSIREIYTDASGSNQFIEMFCTSSGQDFIGGRTITISSGGSNRTFTVPANTPAGGTANKALLFGTAGIQALGAPAPNYIISNNFLFPGGGTISFFGANGGSYTALPTDGVNSYAYPSGVIAVNSPQNFAGQTGSINTSVNTPPFVTITNPPNNALFVAPGTVSVGVIATDNVSVASVQLMTNGVFAGAPDTVAPYGFTLSNLAAGSYTLRARAVDNQTVAATSAPVNVRIASLPTLGALRGSNGPIQLQFNSATGINYVIERAVPLTNFAPIITNAGNGGLLQFAETNGGAGQRTYRVRLQ